MSGKVLLDHGGGGRAAHRLIQDLFLRYLGNEYLNALDDAACLQMQGSLAFSTDSYTIEPLFFPGGNIGSLAVHGTVNDVAMLGARPRFLSCGFILEQGLPLETLQEIVASMAQAAKSAEIQIVAADTKVVPRGKADGIFINTSGLGEIQVHQPPAGKRARAGDAVLLSGNIGDHGLAVMAARQDLGLEAAVKSDSAALHHMLLELLQTVPEVHVLRDPTRGGLASTLNEIAAQSACSIVIQESALPVARDVAQGRALLGLDPLYLANEGKVICILPQEHARQALEIMQHSALSCNAAQIGWVQDQESVQVVMQTNIGGSRILPMLEGEPLPRIC